MPSRGLHHKSRHGCQNCKASHVKCDERCPACNKCCKASKICTYADLVSSHPLTFPGHASLDPAQPISGSLLRSISTTVSLPSDDCIKATNESLGLEQGLPDPSWEDLGLLHHFCTVTHRALGNREDLHEIWRVIIPKMAMDHRFLMHSLLSIAALHLASMQPLTAKKYMIPAIRHHNFALHQFRSNLDSITLANSPALFMCSSLIVIFALGLSASQFGKDYESKSPIEEISNIFVLLNGIQAVLNQAGQWVQHSELGPMFRGTGVNLGIEVPPDFEASLLQLEQHLRNSDTETADKQTYYLTIYELKQCCSRVFQEGAERAMVLSWPANVSPGYAMLLSARRPMALLILAHYAVILHHARDFWWSTGWGKRLIAGVKQAIDGEWQDLMSWPLKILNRGE